MVKEGVGNVPPEPRRVLLSEHDMRCILLGVRDLSRYAGRTDTWGGGLLGDAVVALLAGIPKHERPIVAGKCGEYAVWRVVTEWFGGRFPPVDFTRRAAGDGGIDLRLGQSDVQVKTRVTSKKNLVRRTRGNVVVPLCGDLHVFCEWHGDLWVRVLGWMPTRQVALMPVAQGLGDWENFVVDDARLLPMAALKAELEWRISA